jgi:hypothetical protein
MQLLEVRLRGEKLSNYTGQWGVYTLYRVYTDESKGELARLESGRGDERITECARKWWPVLFAAAGLSPRERPRGRGLLTLGVPAHFLS